MRLPENESAISMLIQYISDNYFEPRKNWPPDIFEEHMQMRSDFIYEKIKINIEKGMEQGMYKKDISSEMIARMYIAKLNDIHNPDIYPPEGFTFATIFNNLIDGVIKNITNEEGRRYYKQRKQLYSILNFR